MISTGLQPESSNTILFLHGLMLRSTRILFSGLMAVAAKRGWNVQHAIPPPGAGTAYIRKLVSFWHPLGLVADYGHEKMIPLPPQDLTMPFVCIDLDPSVLSCRQAPLPPQTGFVDCDSRTLAELAAKALLAQDFAAYAYVSAYERFHWSEQRKRHFRDAVELNGRICQCFDGTGLATSSTAPSRRLGRWLAALPKPCGLLAANDRTAEHVLAIAARENIRVPDELSVIGIDDDEDICEATVPPLSSIRCDFYGGGVRAGEMIGEFLANRHARNLSAGYGVVRLTFRQSTRRTPKNTPSIRLALETIRLRATEGITAADILPLLGGSRRSAERKFRAAVGHGLFEEILNVRFEKVKELLATPASLKAIALQAGFSSSNHLQRLFKAHFGMTLTDFRRNSRPARPLAVRGNAVRG